MYQRGISTIVIIFILVVLFAAGYFILLKEDKIDTTQSNSIKTDSIQKEYRNVRYGYLIQIPDDWGIISEYDGGMVDPIPGPVYEHDGAPSFIAGNNGSIGIQVFDKKIKATYTTEWYIDFYDEGWDLRPLDSGRGGHEVKQVPVGSINATEIRILGFEDSAVVYKDKYIYLFETDESLIALSFDENPASFEVLNSFQLY